MSGGEAEGLRQDVRALADKVDGYHETVIAHVERFTIVHAQVLEHDRAIRGHDGTVGLTAKVDGLMSFRKRVWTVCTILVTAVVGLLARMLTKV